MSYVMREWYGIFWHFLTAFGIGVLVGMYLNSDDTTTVAEQLQQEQQPVVYQANQDQALVTDEASYQFMKNWCEANYGTTGTKGE